MADALHGTRISWWIDGIVGGLIGSVLMGMLAMILFPMFGIGSFWQPMNLIAALFNQSWGASPIFAGYTLMGLVVHMMMAAILGLAFAAAVRTRASGAALVGWATVWGLLVWVVTHLIILPFINPVMAHLFPLWLFAAIHVMFGIGLGWYLSWRWGHTSAPERRAAPLHA